MPRGENNLKHDDDKILEAFDSDWLENEIDRDYYTVSEIWRAGDFEFSETALRGRLRKMQGEKVESKKDLNVELWRPKDTKVSADGALVSVGRFEFENVARSQLTIKRVGRVASLLAILTAFVVIDLLFFSWAATPTHLVVVAVAWVPVVAAVLFHLHYNHDLQQVYMNARDRMGK